MCLDDAVQLLLTMEASHNGCSAEKGTRSGPLRLIAMKWMVTKCARLLSCTHIIIM